VSYRHRVFSATPSDEPPPTFTLDGTLPDGSGWAETFTCVPEAPAGVLDDLVASMGIDGDGNQRFNNVSLLRFIRGVLVEGDVGRFERLVRDKARVVPLETLGEIMLWLAEELTGRPTSRRSVSPDGPPPTTSTSPAVSPSPVSTLPRSTPIAI
jgi:hypothetical protein